MYEEFKSGSNSKSSGINSNFSDLIPRSLSLKPKKSYYNPYSARSQPKSSGVNSRYYDDMSTRPSSSVQKPSAPPAIPNILASRAGAVDIVFICSFSHNNYGHGHIRTEWVDAVSDWIYAKLRRQLSTNKRLRKICFELKRDDAEDWFVYWVVEVLFNTLKGLAKQLKRSPDTICFEVKGFSSGEIAEFKESWKWQKLIAELEENLVIKEH